jgi:hypothetical protein
MNEELLTRLCHNQEAVSVAEVVRLQLHHDHPKSHDFGY